MALSKSNDLSRAKIILVFVVGVIAGCLIGLWTYHYAIVRGRQLYISKDLQGGLTSVTTRRAGGAASPVIVSSRAGISRVFSGEAAELSRSYSELAGIWERFSGAEFILELRKNSIASSQSISELLRFEAGTGIEHGTFELLPVFLDKLKSFPRREPRVDYKDQIDFSLTYSVVGALADDRSVTGLSAWRDKSQTIVEQIDEYIADRHLEYSRVGYAKYFLSVVEQNRGSENVFRLRNTVTAANALLLSLEIEQIQQHFRRLPPGEGDAQELVAPLRLLQSSVEVQDKVDQARNSKSAIAVVTNGLAASQTGLEFLQWANVALLLELHGARDLPRGWGGLAGGRTVLKRIDTPISLDLMQDFSARFARAEGVRILVEANP